MRLVAHPEMSAITPNNTIAVPRLRDDGANWPDYEVKAKTAMGARGLIRHIEGTAKKPISYPEENGFFVKEDKSRATPAEIREREKDIDEYEQWEYSARHIMLTTISPRLSMLVKNHNATQMWNTIKTDATRKSQLHKVDIRRRLQAMTCDEDGDVKAHLNAMMKLREELEAMGSSIADEDFGTMILTSLPRSFDTLLQSITQSANLAGNIIDPNDLTRIVLEESRRREAADQARKSGDAALQTKQAKGRKGKGKRSENGQTCENCKKTNHATEDCFAKGGAKEGQAPWQKKKDKANTASVAVPKTEGEEYLTFTCLLSPSETAAPAETRTTPVDIIIDSGATTHFCPDKAMFVNFIPTHPRPITAADGRQFHATGRGDVLLQVPNGSGSTKFRLKDVAYAPDMAYTLISVAKLDAIGCSAEFRQNQCLVKTSQGKIVATIPKIDGLYRVKRGNIRTEEANIATRTQRLSLAEAHRALGHIHHAAVKHAVNTGKIQGIEIIDTSDPTFCDACAQAKPHRQPFPDKAKNQAEKFGERIHADIWGPASVRSLGGNTYTLDFVDDATRWTEVHFLRQKSEVLEVYKTFEAAIQTQDDAKIKYLRTDRGAEFTSKSFTSHLAAKGTKQELTVHDTHEQVGVAERWNRTKVELARAMLIDSKLPRFLWGEAMHHAAWIKNRSPTRALNGSTPFQVRYNTAPNLSHLVPFGTRAWVKTVNAGKLEARARPGHFVGFDSTSTGYRIYFPDKRKIRIEREVAFNLEETTDPVYWTAETQSEGEKSKLIQHHADDPVDDLPRTDDAPNDPQPTQRPQVQPPEREDPPPRRTRPQPGYYRTLAGLPAPRESVNSSVIALEDPGPDEPLVALLTGAVGSEPRTLKEALAGPDANQWKSAYDAEIDQLKRLRTWDIVDRPSNKPVIPCGYVFKVKLGPNAEVLKYKARVVAGGHRQIKGVNYEETFAAAAKIGSIRVLLTLAAQRDWEIHQVDVVGAYLNADLEDEVYMEVPDGILSDGDRTKVCRLRKGLYGLKQAGKRWYDKMALTFVSLGFSVSKLDQSVFIRTDGKETVHVPVSTDDMVVMGSSRAAVEKVKTELKHFFEITDQGELSWLLGFEVRRDRAARMISLNQKAYIEALARRFGLTDGRPVHIAMDPGTVLSRDQCPDEPIDVPYQEACGGVLWPAVITRPDVQLAVGILSQFNQNPGNAHWEALKRLIKYLHTTKDLWLTLGGAGTRPNVYSDADWASQPDRHSISGLVAKLGQGAMTWSSKRQTLIAQSSTEAEYVAAAVATREIYWLRSFMSELGLEEPGPTTLWVDNQSTIAMTKNSRFHARTKHIDIRHHFVREAVEHQTISVKYIPTSENIADGLTKPLPRPAFELFVRNLGLLPA